MKNKTVFALFFIFLIFFVSCPLVHADWTLVEEEGRWAIKTREEWKSNWDDDWCFMEWHLTVQNFTAWIITIDSEIYQDMWLVDTWHHIGLVIEKNGKWYGVSLTNYQHKGINFMGIAFLSVSSCSVQYIFGDDDWRTAKTTSLCVDWRVRIFRNTQDELQIQVEGFSGNDVVLAWEIKRYVPPDFWIGNATLIMAMSEETSSLFWQNGQVYGKILNEQIITNLGGSDWTLGSETDWWKKVAMSVWQWITVATQPFKPVADFLGQLWNFLTYAGKFLGTLFANVQLFLPLFINLFVLWVFLFIIGQIVIGDLYPIYDFFTNVYQFFANLISMIANVLQTIYEHIKFW
ncbi:MAG: hypothetical protein QXP36_04285 [Conexivisphaerales archaeon]